METYTLKKNEKHSSSSERQTVNTKIPRTTKKTTNFNIIISL